MPRLDFLPTRVHGHAHLTHLVLVGQYFAVFWLAVAVSIASTSRSNWLQEFAVAIFYILNVHPLVLPGSSSNSCLPLLPHCMEDHQPAVAEAVLCKCGRGSQCVGGLGRATILLIIKKGYKQVMKKISNEIKRMQGCLFSNEEICYWSTMYSNKGVTQNGNS